MPENTRKHGLVWQFSWQLAFRSWKTGKSHWRGHGMSWDLKSSKEYEPCTWIILASVLHGQRFLRSRGTRERICILISSCRREKSRIFVKTANWPPLKFFPGALGLVFVYTDSSPLGLLRIHNHNFLFTFSSHNAVFHDHTTYPVERTS